jgi:hypothetical protein
MIVDLFESESIVTTHRACHTMATAPFGRVRSVASRDLLGLPDAQAWPDSRRYRKKIRTILEATRWRLRLLVGLAQLLRVTFPDCRMLRPSRTVGATGKDPHDSGGRTMATAPFGRARSGASYNFLGLPDAQA